MDVEATRTLFQKPEKKAFFIVTQGLDGPLYYIGEAAGYCNGDWTTERDRATHFDELPIRICSGNARLCENAYCQTKDYSLAFPYFEAGQGRDGDSTHAGAFAVGVPITVRR